MIFPVLELERIVQVADKTRLNAAKSYVTPDEAAITLVEIEPEASVGFIDITSTLYLDWQYATDGEKTVSLRVTTDGSPESITKTIPVISAEDDALFSNDSQLVDLESDILQYTKNGRNSWINVHRAAQERILTILDENGFWDQEGNKLTKASVTDVSEFQDWSKYMTLRMIFEQLSNVNDDKFNRKAIKYREFESIARDRARILIDRNNDGTSTVEEAIEFRTIELVRE